LLHIQETLAYASCKHSDPADQTSAGSGTRCTLSPMHTFEQLLNLHDITGQ